MIPQGICLLPQGYSSDTKRKNEVSLGTHSLANDTLRKESLEMANDTLRKESLEIADDTLGRNPWSTLPCVYKIPQGILGIL
jgi:hypothetical protein